ncbi:MAG: M23 family metallopeptidase [Pleurocapsa sp. MO_226.B13]|nr:M23 family metallopeptidase [Pleurocapsa sp. MO_226.B13]
MLRSILLGLLAIATVPLTLADATATSNTQDIFSQQSTNSYNLARSCNPRSTSCDSSVTVNHPEINSQLWLKNLGNILLSGSMFKGCKMELGQEQYYSSNNPELLPSQLKTTGCIFSWQQPREIQTKPKGNQELLSTKLASDYVRPQNLSQSDRELAVKSVATTPKFPKLSRSSLIVSFPTADSTLIPNDTKFANPAPETNRIASPFGWRRRPYSHQLQFHQGIDYSAPLGSPVVAVGNGIVTNVVSGCYDFGNLFCGGQLGNWIEIDHGNGAVGIYGHLKHSSIAVQEGMKVWKNQEIARVGSSGWSTGAHLDFRLKVDGEFEDPTKYLTPPTISRIVESTDPIN